MFVVQFPIGLYVLCFLYSKMVTMVTNMARQPMEISTPFTVLRGEPRSLPGIEIRALVRARLASSPRVKFTQYVPDPLKALLTDRRHSSSTATGLQTLFWAIWQVGSEMIVQASVGVAPLQVTMKSISELSGCRVGIGTSVTWMMLTSRIPSTIVMVALK